MIYFDTAYIAKCYLNEPAAEKVRSVAEESDGLCSCELARAELFATVHRHLREGRLRRTQVRQVLARFEADERDGVWSWLPVSADLIRSTCEALRGLPATVFIRSVDALHLQCAREHGQVEVYTSDRHMIAAASHFQVIARNVLA